MDSMRVGQDGFLISLACVVQREGILVFLVSKRKAWWKFVS
jgi:hypothetical protein